MVPTDWSSTGQTCTVEGLIDWVKEKVKRKYLLYFICHHSLEKVEPPMEIEVARSWVVQVAPVLKLGLFLLKTAAAINNIPIPDLQLSEQLSVMKDFVDSLLEDAAKNLLDSWEEATNTAITEGTISDTDISEVRSLTGPPYDMIAQKVNKPKRSQWKESMTPVINHNGHPIWVKNEYQHLYE
jgi:hypothetical protein